MPTMEPGMMMTGGSNNNINSGSSTGGMLSERCSQCNEISNPLLACDPELNHIKISKGSPTPRYCNNCMRGKKVKVYWPVDQSWYTGEVQDYDPSTGEHELCYPDGDREWVKIGDIISAAAAGARGMENPAAATPTTSIMSANNSTIATNESSSFGNVMHHNHPVQVPHQQQHEHSNHDPMMMMRGEATSHHLQRHGGPPPPASAPTGPTPTSYHHNPHGGGQASPPRSRPPHHQPPPSVSSSYPTEHHAMQSDMNSPRVDYRGSSSTSLTGSHPPPPTTPYYGKYPPNGPVTPYPPTPHAGMSHPPGPNSGPMPPHTMSGPPHNMYGPGSGGPPPPSEQHPHHPPQPVGQTPPVSSNGPHGNATAGSSGSIGQHLSHTQQMPSHMMPYGGMYPPPPSPHAPPTPTGAPAMNQQFLHRPPHQQGPANAVGGGAPPSYRIPPQASPPGSGVGGASTNHPGMVGGNYHHPHHPYPGMGPQHPQSYYPPQTQSLPPPISRHHHNPQHLQSHGGRPPSPTSGFRGGGGGSFHLHPYHGGRDSGGVDDDDNSVSNQQDSGPGGAGGRSRKMGPKPWTKEEDNLLLTLVHTMQWPMKWTIVAQSLPDRTGKQCRERYVNHLNPRLKASDWNPVEDSTIFHLYNTIGSHWAKMSKIIPGRTDNGIKNRFHNIRRQYEREDTHRVRLSCVTDFPDEVRLDRLRKFPEHLEGKSTTLWDMKGAIGVLAAQSVLGVSNSSNSNSIMGTGSAVNTINGSRTTSTTGAGSSSTNSNAAQTGTNTGGSGLNRFGPFRLADVNKVELCVRCGLLLPSVHTGNEICTKTGWCQSCTRLPPNVSGNLLRECLNLRRVCPVVTKEDQEVQVLIEAFLEYFRPSSSTDTWPYHNNNKNVSSRSTSSSTKKGGRNNKDRKNQMEEQDEKEENGTDMDDEEEGEDDMIDHDEDNNDDDEEQPEM